MPGLVTATVMDHSRWPPTVPMPSPHRLLPGPPPHAYPHAHVIPCPNHSRLMYFFVGSDCISAHHRSSTHDPGNGPACCRPTGFNQWCWQWLRAGAALWGWCREGTRREEGGERGGGLAPVLVSPVSGRGLCRRLLKICILKTACRSDNGGIQIQLKTSG